MIVACRGRVLVRGLAGRAAPTGRHCVSIRPSLDSAALHPGLTSVRPYGAKTCAWSIIPVTLKHNKSSTAKPELACSVKVLLMLLIPAGRINSAGEAPG